jgi:hypothetical protein
MTSAAPASAPSLVSVLSEKASRIAASPAFARRRMTVEPAVGARQHG